MSSSFTPGPWYQCGDEVLVDMGDRPHLVATVADWSEDTEPYARLIAAAPDTAAEALAFTYTVERYMRAGDGSDPRVPPTEAEVSQALYALRAHIAKATGSAP